MTMEEQFEFDFNEVLNEFRNGKRLTGKDGLLAPLIKQLTQAALEAEVESHIAQDVLNGTRNRRNGVNGQNCTLGLNTTKKFKNSLIYV